MDDRMPIISGAALICALGHDPDNVLQNLFSEKEAVAEAAPGIPSHATHPVMRVADFNAREFLEDKKTLRFMSRETQFAVCAVRFCMTQARIIPGQTHDGGEIAYFAGTGSSGIDLVQIEKLLAHTAHDQTGFFDPIKFGREALDQLNPLTSFKILPNMPPAVAAIYAGIKGNNLIFNPWEGNALLAFWEAVWAVRSGRERVVLCSGSDCKTHSNALLTFTEYGLLDAAGIILSEGSACLALESAKDVRKRQAAGLCGIRHVLHRSYPLSENAGYACAADVYAEMMTAVLSESGLKPTDIDWIIASNDHHGANDAAENQAISQVMGACPTSAPKKRMGNTFAAAGVIHLALGAHLLKKGFSPAGKPIRRILVNSLGPGSELFCIVLEGLCHAS